MKKALALFLILCSLCSFVGCSDEPEDYSVTIAIDGIPKSLDPQIASASSELAVIYNSCEGLMRFTPDGSVTYGAAAAHSVSSDLLTYTFTLRENMKWSDGQPLKAEDFVFGIKRAVLPETKSPSAESFFAIKGAKEVYEGTANASDLAVKASGKTVIIELSYPDKDLLRTLASAAAMPCREEFFYSAKGKYGLSADLFISSGPFYVKKWSQDTSSVSLRISKNPEYNGSFVAKPASVVMFFNNKNDLITEIYEGQMGSAYLPAGLYSQAVQKKLNTAISQTESYILSLNNAAPIFSTQKMRSIFAKAINREVIKSKLCHGATLSQSIIPTGYTYADSVYSPSGLLSFEESAAAEYLDELKVITDTLNSRLKAKDDAEKAYLEAVEEAHKHNKPIPEKPVEEKTPYSLYSPWDSKDKVETDFSVICENSQYIIDAAQMVASCWEKAFGITVTVKPLTNDELKAACATGNYFAAVTSVKNDDCTARSFLYSFTSYSSQNAVKYANEQYDTIISNMQKNGVTDESLSQAVNLLNLDASIIPLFTFSHMIASMSNISNIRFVTPNGRIDFTEALNAD